MQNLTIDTGVVELTINGDPARSIRFDPSDVVFAEKFYTLLGEFERKLTEFQDRASVLENETGIDDNGVPINLADRLALIREGCEYIRAQIDFVFGPGTSQAAFADRMNLEMFSQFFGGITPYIKGVRSTRIEKYAAPARRKKVRVK